MAHVDAPDGVTPEDVARVVWERIQVERASTVLAVWADARITTEGFGFYGHRRPDGTWRTPIASFPAKTFITEGEVLEKLLAGLRKHGLLPAE